MSQSAIYPSAAGAVPLGAATSANQTNGNQKTQIVDGSGNVIASTSNALNVNLTAGSAVVGKVSIDQTTPGTTNGVQVNAALPAGTNAIGKLAANDGVDIGDVTVNNASGASAVNIQDGGNSITVDNGGTFAVQVNSAIPSGTNLIGKVGIDQTTVGTTNAVSLAQVGATTVATGNGTVSAGVQRVAIASDNTAFSVNAVQSGSWTVKETRPGTATLTNVNDSASSQSLLASNSSRLGASFFNDSTSTLYLKLGTTASTTSYTVQVPPSGYYELPFPAYTGAIDGIWSSDSTGAVRITELT